MIHPSRRRILEFASGELTAHRSRRVSAHLAACPRCRWQVQEIRSLREALVALPIPELPDDGWQQILARRQAGDVVLLPASTPAPAPAVRNRRLLRRAAFIALAVATAAVAATLTLPGGERRESPAPRVRQTAPTAVTPAAAPQPAAEATAGVSIDLEADTARLAVEGAGEQLRIRVRLVDDPAVGVRATGAAIGSVFRPVRGGLTVRGAPSGELLISIPRAARRVVLQVNGSTYLVKEAEGLRVLSPGADTAGAEFVLPVRP